MTATTTPISEHTASILKSQFDEVGYCIADNIYSEAELSRIEAFFEAYRTHGGTVFDTGVKYEEIDPTKRQLRAMHPHRYSSQVVEWMTHPRVAAVLELLFGRPALAVATMYYYKPPGAKGQGMHQDNFYLMASPSACIAAWTPIDDADVENGCLYVAPGTQNLEILCPENKTDRWMGYGDSHISQFPRDAKPVPVPVKRGQTLFFGGKLIHGSGPNRTKNRSRRTFIGHYVDQNTERLSKFYYPVFAMDRSSNVSGINLDPGGGPCGDDWRGAVH